MKKQRMSVYTIILIAIIIIALIVGLLVILLPREDNNDLNTQTEKSKDISGDENIEVEGDTKNNISSRLHQTREIEEGLEASEISITTTEGKSVISFLLTNDSDVDMEDVDLEVKVRDEEDQDVRVLRSTVTNLEAGEEKEVKIEVDGDIANAKDVAIRKVDTKVI